MQLSRSTKWLLILLLWAGIAAIQATVSFNVRLFYGRPASWTDMARITFVAVFLAWGVLLTPAVFFLCRRFPVETQNWPRRVAFHAIFATVAPFLIAAFRVPFHSWVYPNSPDHGMMAYKGYLYSNAFDDFTMYWVLLFVCHAWTYYRRYRDRELTNALLESQLARAELQVLKMQLHPHFLFNTLHSISELMHQDVQAADKTISLLADLLRMTLQNTRVHEIPLKDELDFLRGYFEIEQTRFRDRLKVKYEIEPGTLDALVPNMLLQPLAENSIRHGIAVHAGNGTVLVKSWLADGRLRLLLRNYSDVSGAAAETRPSFGVGLSNTRMRLQQMYGPNHTFETRRPTDFSFEVEIAIPYTAATAVEQAQQQLQLTTPAVVRPMSEQVSP
jgi:hypothetical protein